MSTPSSIQMEFAMRSVLAALAGLLGIGGGFLAGATYGGNCAPDVFFAGVRGYEAMGLVGAVAGGVTCVGAVVLASRR